MQKIKQNRWVTLMIICIGFLIILIDTTVVNVSIPTIIKELHATLSDIEWIISGYALSFAALLITFGRLGDVYGRRTMFLLGLFVFALASFFSGEAQTAQVLIFARLFQGIGGAMISPATLSILSSSFKGKDRAVAFGIWGAVAGIAVAIGPILGGYFTTYWSWRWIFRINIPICLIGIIAAFFFIENTKETIKQKLDISGMILSSIGFFFLVFGLIEGETYGWILPKKIFQLGAFSWDNKDISIIFISFIISEVTLLCFIILQFIKTKRKLSPAVNIDFFRLRSYRYGLVAIAVISLGEFSSLFTIPIFLQNIREFTPLQSGLGLLPLAIATLIAAPLSAKLVNIIGTKWVISTGIFLEFIALLLFSFITAKTSYNELIFPFFVLGAGIGLAIAQNTQVILSEIPREASGSASGVLNTVRQVGSALGIAVIGAVLSSQILVNITSEINKISQLPLTAKNAIIAKAGEGGVSYDNNANPKNNLQPIPPQIAQNPQLRNEYIKMQVKTREDIKNAVNNSLANAIAASIRVGSVFVLLGAILSLLIPNIKHPKETPIAAE